MSRRLARCVLQTSQCSNPPGVIRVSNNSKTHRVRLGSPTLSGTMRAPAVSTLFCSPTIPTKCHSAFGSTSFGQQQQPQQQQQQPQVNPMFGNLSAPASTAAPSGGFGTCLFIHPSSLSYSSSKARLPIPVPVLSVRISHRRVLARSLGAQARSGVLQITHLAKLAIPPTQGQAFSVNRPLRTQAQDLGVQMLLVQLSLQLLCLVLHRQVRRSC